MAKTNLFQSGWRVRNDDGSETTATWRAATDVYPNPQFRFDEVFRVRFLITRPIGDTQTDLARAMALKESHNGGTYNFIQIANRVTKAAPGVTTNFVDSDPTTQQLGSEEYALEANKCMAAAPSNTLATGSWQWFFNASAIEEMECEYAFSIPRAGSGLVTGDTLEYRVLWNGLPLTLGYPVKFILTVELGGLRISGGTLQVSGG